MIITTTTSTTTISIRTTSPSSRINRTDCRLVVVTLGWMDTRRCQQGWLGRGMMHEGVRCEDVGASEVERCVVHGGEEEGAVERGLEGRDEQSVVGTRERAGERRGRVATHAVCQ
jgi:hypothetical protein